MNAFNTFNSKDTYLAARAEWKANYAQLTLDIRKARSEYNDAQRAFSKTKYTYGGGEANIPYNDAWRAVWEALNALAALRREAREAIEDRVASKVEAARQWEAVRALEKM